MLPSQEDGSGQTSNGHGTVANPIRDSSASEAGGGGGSWGTWGDWGDWSGDWWDDAGASNEAAGGVTIVVWSGSAGGGGSGNWMADGAWAVGNGQGG